MEAIMARYHNSGPIFERRLWQNRQLRRDTLRSHRDPRSEKKKKTLRALAKQVVFTAGRINRHKAPLSRTKGCPNDAGLPQEMRFGNA